MAELSLTQYLAKGVPDPFEAGLLETIITTDELVSTIPWLSTGSDTYKYLREKALPAFGFLAASATITPDGASQDAEVSTYLRTVGGDMRFNNLQGARGGGTRSVVARAIAKAGKSLGRAVGNALINGSTAFTYTLDSTATTLAATITGVVPGPNHDTRMPYGAIRYTHVGTTFAYRAPGDAAFGAEVIVAPSTTVRVYSDNPSLYVDVTRNAVAIGADATGALVLSGGTAEFDGLIVLSPTSQQVATATNGESLTFGLLDKLLEANKDSGAQKYLLMPGRTYVSFEALCRTMGGVTMTEVQGVKRPTYNGAIILKDDWIPVTQTKGTSSTCTSIWCLTLGSENGFCGIYNEAPPDDMPPPNAALLTRTMPGIQVWDLGIDGTMDSRKLRATAYVSAAQKLVPGLSWANGILD